MANVGLAHVVMAKLNSDNSYSDGFVCGKATNASVNKNFSEASLYGDDELAEYVKSYKDADITLGITSIPNTAQNVLFGHAANADGGYTSLTTDIANYVGVGFYVTKMEDNITKFLAFFYKKVKFSEAANEFATKGDSISFATPSLSGKGLPVNNEFETTAEFETAAEAIAWLDSMANIQSGSAPHVYTQTELEAMTVQQIEDLANSLGYTLTGSTKDDKIQSFLTEQAA